MRKLRIKKSTKQYIIVALICVVIVGSAALFAYFISTRNMKEYYEAKLTAANQEMEENRRKVYIATDDIMAGGLINEKNTEYVSTYASQDQKTYIDKNDIGKIALVDIKKGTQILKSIITDSNVSNDLREAVFSVITISSNVINGDTVDIRLQYPNGENYIVLPKKRIKKKDVVTNTEDESQETVNNSTASAECYFWLSEEEIVRMSSAIVDAYLYKGSQIYTTEYIEPNLQEASIVNYTPSLATINLIKNDPNIVKIASDYLSNIVRKELENRLAQSLNTEVKDVKWDTNNNLSELNELDETTEQTGEEKSEVVNGSSDESDNFYYGDEVEDKKEDTEYGQ